MKLLLTFCLTLLLRPVYAQDIVYLNDQTQIAGIIAEITPEKVSLRVTKGESTIKFSYGADRVAAVVNQRGRFLCLNQLKEMPADERDRSIARFMNNENVPAHDIIIRAIPQEAIYGTVSYSQGDAVNYTNLDGAAASLPKSDLVGIFYSTGKHELFADASFLCDKPNLLANEPVTVTPVAVAPAVKEQPVMAVKPASDTQTDTRDKVDKPVPKTVNTVLQLTDQQYEEYRAQALERVQEFAVLLGVVADKTADASQKDKAIVQVLKLFKTDAAIQVSSMVRGGQPATYKIKDYLIRLKLLPYKSVSLEWTDIQYVQNLTQKDDGNYYGKIKGEQRFSALNSQGDVQYGDITQKDVEVMLTPYKKKKEGVDEGNGQFSLVM